MTVADPAFLDALFAAAVSHHLDGRAEQAMEAYRRLLTYNPHDAECLNNLGCLLRARDRQDEATDCFRRAAEARPDYADAHHNLGIVLRDLDRMEEAETCFRRAVGANPDHAGACFDLGMALAGRGRMEEAAACFLHAAEISPGNADAWDNLGVALHKLTRCDHAEIAFRRALEASPDHAASMNHLGGTLHTLGRLDEAEAWSRRAAELMPDHAGTHLNLGNILYDLGRLDEAMACSLRALALDDSWSSRSLFTSCVRRLPITAPDTALRHAMTRALSDPWCRPNDLMRAAGAMVTGQPAVAESIHRMAGCWPERLPLRSLLSSEAIVVLSDDPLLNALLVSAPVCDIDLERLLTSLRSALLTKTEPGLLPLHAALARQCFINEYVFAWTEPEEGEARRLRDWLAGALDAGSPIPPDRLVAMASYFPLHALPGHRRLLDRPWPSAVADVLDQQIREVEAISRQESAIACLTPMNGEDSKDVRRQYEENPYPRWMRPAPSDTPLSIEAFMRASFPFHTPCPPPGSANPEILIAGCGTGQHSTETARRHPGARVLAIDLSRASLRYARHKSVEQGLDAIEYAQADIMRLGTLGRSFHIIESVGVLHHLAAPLEGWQVLLDLLRPGGLMNLGLYSATARRDIERGRAFIAERGYGPVPEDIRRCRQDMIGRPDLGSIIDLDDFFSTSACRDLLFHCREHLMTLDVIDAFLRQNGLIFLGFRIDRRVLHAYRRRFPHDRAATDLGQWREFECDNPDTFRGMYQFWLQKPHQPGNVGIPE